MRMNELTEKDLHCIAQHMQEYVKKVMHRESKFPCACTNCTFISDCGKTPVLRYNWDTFLKLSKITGVKISPRKGFKV